MNPRNTGMTFDAALLDSHLDPGTAASWEVSTAPPSSVELLSMVRCMDFTTLGGDDTPESVHAFCERAKTPVSGQWVAAVCLYPVFVRHALSALEGTGIRVATVAAAFPHGLAMLPNRVAEVEAACDLGADDIDIVIQRAKALCGEWPDLYREIRLFREACGDAHLKVILETGELGTDECVYKAAMTAMLAGADFVKTSTGKTSVNATPGAATAMLRAVAAYRAATGQTVGFKPAGGIRTSAQAVTYMRLAQAAMGDAYIDPATFRIGASSLLDDVAKGLAA